MDMIVQNTKILIYEAMIGLEINEENNKGRVYKVMKTMTDSDKKTLQRRTMCLRIPRVLSI